MFFCVVRVEFINAWVAETTLPKRPEEDLVTVKMKAGRPYLLCKGEHVTKSSRNSGIYLNI